MIAIFTQSEDIHSLLVQDAVRRLGYPDVHMIECDRIAGQDTLQLAVGYPDRERGQACFTSNEGRRIAMEDVSLIWLRRPQTLQVKPAALDPLEQKFIDNECRGGLNALFSSLPFHGQWVSSPQATSRASDKILQLRTALEHGFRIPRTIVTQSRDDVVAFYESCGGQIIAKPLAGVVERLLVTQRVADPALLPPEAFSACPAIYQELIPGTRHVRLNCFGDIQVAALIESQDLDWRPNLRVPIEAWPVPEEVRVRTRRVLDALGLEMGILDFKLTPEGELVWLEVNPQGQFLFLSPLLKQDLAGIFARFLTERAQTAGSERTPALMEGTTSRKAFHGQALGSATIPGRAPAISITNS